MHYPYQIINHVVFAEQIRKRKCNHHLLYHIAFNVNPLSLRSNNTNQSNSVPYSFRDVYWCVIKHSWLWIGIVQGKDLPYHAMICQRDWWVDVRMPQIILILCSRWGYVVTPRHGHCNPREGAPAPTAEEAGWVSGSLWKGVVKRKSLYPTAVRTSDRPAQSEQ